jgi:hypothetical protein
LNFKRRWWFHAAGRIQFAIGAEFIKSRAFKMTREI